MGVFCEIRPDLMDNKKMESQPIPVHFPDTGTRNLRGTVNFTEILQFPDLICLMVSGKIDSRWPIKTKKFKKFKKLKMN